MSHEPYCNDCDTDAHIVATGRQSVGTFNATGVQTESFRCTECGAEGSHKQMPSGTTHTEGALYNEER